MGAKGYYFGFDNEEDWQEWKKRNHYISGNKFEDIFWDNLYLLSQYTPGAKAKNCVGTYLDREEGTDMMIHVPGLMSSNYSLRLDPTLNFNEKPNDPRTKDGNNTNKKHGKDFMPYVLKSDIKLEGYNVWFGIRHGNSYNGYTGFEEPVVVIGLDVDEREFSYLKRKDRLDDALYHNMKKIIATAMYCCRDYKAATPERRKTIQDMHMSRNPNYIKPKEIRHDDEYGRRYEIIDSWRDKHLYGIPRKSSITHIVPANERTNKVDSQLNVQQNQNKDQKDNEAKCI